MIILLLCLANLVQAAALLARGWRSRTRKSPAWLLDRLSGLSFWKAYPSQDPAQPEKMRADILLGLVLVTNILLFAWLLWTAFYSTPTKSAGSSMLWQALPYWAALTTLGLWAYGLVFLNHQRSNKEAIDVSQNLELVFNASPDAIAIVCQSDGRFVNTNEAFSALTGYSSGEMVGKTLAEVKLYRDPAELQKVFAQVKTQDSINNLETVFQRKDGLLITAVLSVKKIVLQNVPFIIIVAQDITGRKEMEDALRESEERHRVMFMDSPDAHLLLVDAHFLDCNHAAEAMLRGKRSQIIGKMPSELSPEHQPDGQRSSEAQFERMDQVPPTGVSTFEWIHRRLDGEDFYVEVAAVRMVLDGKPGLFITWRDITGRKLMEQALESANNFHLNLLSNAPALIWRAGTDAKCDWFNKGWLEFTGRAIEEELGDGWASGVHADDFEQCLSIYLSAFNARRPFVMDYRLMHHSGEYRWISDHGIPFETISGEFGGYIGYCFDITERRQLQEELEQQATTDSLTGVFNRRRFMELAQTEIKRSARRNHPLALALVDLDHFKDINDQYGHATGDQVLMTFSQTCLKNIREIDIFARIGGDEFVLLLPETTLEQAYRVVERIRARLAAHPLETNDGQQVAVTLSSGLAAFNGSDETLDELLARTDRALYQSKHAGRNRVTAEAERVQS